jgi:O-antigen/teichoic acid export membrane protein
MDRNKDSKESNVTIIINDSDAVNSKNEGKIDQTDKPIEESCKSSVKKNTFYNIIKTFSSIIFPLITFPYISRVLGADNIGKINFGSSIVSYFTLIATLGVTAYAVRECSRIKDDKEKLGKTASQIISINLVTTLVSYIGLAVCLFAVPQLHTYQLLITIQSISILLTTLGADWLNTAMEDFRFITVRTFVFQLISFTAMLIFVHRPEHYIVYAIISVISSSGANVVNIFYRRRYCNVNLTFHMDWKKHLPPIMMLFVMLLSQQILSQLDTTMLGFMKGDTAVGLYSTAVKVIGIVTQVTVSITWVVMPQLSYQYERKNYTEINKLLRYVLSFTMALGLPCFAGINILADEIIFTIAGTEYMAAANCLRIMSLAMLCSFANNIYGNLILLPSNRERQFAIACLSAAGVNAVTNAIFIPMWGINGASLTTVISSFIMTFIARHGIEKEIKIDNKFTLIKGPVIGSAVVAVLCLLFKTVFNNRIIILISSIIISAIAYILILLKMKNEFAIEIITPMKNKFKQLIKK